MVKTAEKDAATSPESPFFDPPCGIEKSGGSVIAQSSRKQRSVSMARWYLTQCALSDVSGRDFYWQEEIPRFTGLEGASALRAVDASRNMRRLYKMDVPSR